MVKRPLKLQDILLYRFYETLLQSFFLHLLSSHRPTAPRIGPLRLMGFCYLVMDSGQQPTSLTIDELRRSRWNHHHTSRRNKRVFSSSTTCFCYGRRRTCRRCCQAPSFPASVLLVMWSGMVVPSTADGTPHVPWCSRCGWPLHKRSSETMHLIMFCSDSTFLLFWCSVPLSETS